MKSNTRIGSYYACGGLFLLTLTSAVPRPWAWLLLWPSASVFLIAAGYWRFGKAVYAKHNGSHPFWSRALHFFTMLGHEISRRLYARQCRAWDKVLPNLWIGRHLQAAEARQLIQEGVTAVLDLTAEFSETAVIREGRYLSLPILDLTAPSSKELNTALDFIDSEIKQGSVYVHCKIGYSRTAAVVGAYLLHAGHASTPEEAMHLLREARPSIVIRPEAEAIIRHNSRQCPLR